MTDTEESKILRFIQLLPNTSPSIKFSNGDLPGSGKRIDILCRVLSACFDWGPSSLSKTRCEVKAILANEMTLTFSNPEEPIPCGEVAWANEIREALQGNPSKFIKLEPLGLNGVLNSLVRGTNSRAFALDGKGTPISPTFFQSTRAQNSFMLGDHQGFDSESLRIIRNEDIQQISLGERSYLSSHCVAVLIAEFERFGN